MLANQWVSSPLVRLRRSGFEQFDPEATAAAGFRGETDAAAHAFDGLLDDGETHSRARIGLDGMQAFKNTEDLFVVLTRDANAIILDANADGFPSFLGPNRHLRSHAAGHKLKGVAQQMA